MTDKLTSHERMTRGRDAEAALEMLDKAFDEIRSDLFDGWLKSRPEETVLRERIYYTALGLGEAARKLGTWRDTGKIEEEIARKRSE